MSKEKRCECDAEGVLKDYMINMYHPTKELPFVNHKPNKCRCKNDLRQYIRNKKVVWLCSCCCLFTDREVQEEERK